MTRKDFEFFADLIGTYHNLTMDYDSLDDMMAYFEQRNSNFKRGRFLLACGFDREEIADIWDCGKAEF